MYSVKQRLLEFLDAENRRDWNLYETYLSPEVEWTSYGPPRRETVRGKSEYLSAMKNAYEGRDSRFAIVNLVVDEERQVAMAELEIGGRRSVDVFEFRDGLIFREREYFDDTYWLNTLPR